MRLGKAVGLAHGFATLAVRLGVLKPCASGDIVLYKSRYKVQQVSGQSLTAIDKFLDADLHRYLRSMPSIKSVSQWNEVYGEFAETLTPKALPCMTQDGYNMQWTFRHWHIAEARQSLWFQRLYFSESDLVVDLPKPDQAGHLKELARKMGGEKKATISELYRHPKWKPKCAPEVVAAVLCISHSVTFAEGKRSQSVTAQTSKGPCVQCKDKCKGATYCRIVKGHTASEAPKTGRGVRARGDGLEVRQKRKK